MNTNELLEALKPYAPSLSWGTVIQKWYVVLWDLGEAVFYGATPDEALRAALVTVVLDPANG